MDTEGRGGMLTSALPQFFSIQTNCDGPEISPPSIKWVPGPNPARVNRPGREADHSSPYRTKVKNGGAILRLPMSSWYSA
jgi:hypothetical protein